MIRVLLVDDHAAFRQPLAFMLGREPDMTVVGQAGTLREARQMLDGVDVALVDIHLLDGSGVDLIREVVGANQAAHVVILTASLDQLDIALAVEAGASGVLHKAETLDNVIGAIRRAAAGEVLLTPRQVVELVRLAGQRREQERTGREALARLTVREREVLQALADGLADKEIALRLGISPETVRTHMVNLLGKLGVESRLQALVFAIRHGVIQIE